MPKQPIRDELLRRRRAQALAAQQAHSCQIQQRFLATAEFAAARCIALYSPVQGEVQTALLATASFRCGKRVVYPRLGDGQLTLVEVDGPDDLRPGAFGVLEPVGHRLRAIGEVDLLVVPGVVFDRQGHRLGYGKGFYDRLLHGADHACKAGLAFDFQVIAELPIEEHDVRMDLLVTESKLLRWPDGVFTHG